MQPACDLRILAGGESDGPPPGVSRPAGAGVGRVHELSIASEVYRTSRSAVAEHGGGRLIAVRLAVGELTAIEPELLGFAWQALLAASADAGARLDVEWRPARQHCAACDAVKPRSEGSWLRLCPDCGQPLSVSGGDELDVLSVEFEQDGGESHD